MLKTELVINQYKGIFSIKAGSKFESKLCGFSSCNNGE